jgi:hypothetical protein
MWQTSWATHTFSEQHLQVEEEQHGWGCVALCSWRGRGICSNVWAAVCVAVCKRHAVQLVRCDTPAALLVGVCVSHKQDGAAAFCWIHLHLKLLQITM